MLLDESKKINRASIGESEHTDLRRLKVRLQIRAHALDDFRRRARQPAAKPHELHPRRHTGDRRTGIDLAPVSAIDAHALQNTPRPWTRVLESDTKILGRFQDFGPHEIVHREIARMTLHADEAQPGLEAWHGETLRQVLGVVP